MLAQLHLSNALARRYVLIIYSVITLMLFHDILFNEVIAPHRQLDEVGLSLQSDQYQHVENRKFNDFSSAFIPEITAHLKTNKSSWLATWTNDNELGRPLYHLSGFSPAYLPSWIISTLTHNPWRFITALSLLTCYLTGLFMILFCAEIGLKPFSGLVAALCFSFSPVFMYWLTFPMFAATWCWTLGALWAISRIKKKPDVLSWAILSFSFYSLLMTAYPQSVVFNLYIIVGFGMHVIVNYLRANHNPLRFIGFTASAAIVGGLLAFPMYMDVVLLAAESARARPETVFFTIYLPKFTSIMQAVQFVALSTFPEFLGNTIQTNFPYVYNGLSYSVAYIFFGFLGVMFAFKRIWGWCLAVIILLLFSFIHPLYEFGVAHLGFNISRSSPLGRLPLPLAMIMAFGVDALIRRSEYVSMRKGILYAGGVCLLLILISLYYAFEQQLSIRWSMVVVALFSTIVLVFQSIKVRPWLILSICGLLTATVSYPLILLNH